VTAHHYADNTVTVHHADALDVLHTLPDTSVDAVVTDPPYGLEFASNGWDFRLPAAARFRTRQDQRTNPSVGKSTVTTPEAYIAGAPYQQWCQEWAHQCLRVLKPGAHLVTFGGTRTVHRLTCAIEDAGFEIRDGIDWIHSQGLPKSLNLGDGRGTALKPAREPIVVARKPLSGTVTTTAAAYGTGTLNIDACRIEGGRWPTNLVLSHAPDCTIRCTPGCPVNELGSESRFFPVFRYEPKAAGSERPRVNGTTHPTVKPLGLMRWLVRLVAPAGGVVLDPFAGSGTTAEACVIEGIRCIAIEQEADYLPLITARLSKPLQPALSSYGGV